MRIASNIPCNGCQSRTQTCHGKCERYLEYRSARIEMLEYINCIRNVEPDKDSEEMVNIADGWAKDHPVKTRKTRQSELLKMFPDAQIDTYGALTIRPCSIEKGLCSKCTTLSDCVDCRREFWLKEIEG